MQSLMSELQVHARSEHPLTTKILRQWCSPDVILAITDIVDEEVLQFHAIEQARQSNAKVLLVHLGPSGFSSEVRGPARLRNAQMTLDRMARQLRWVGISCEPIAVRGLRPDEIPPIARSCCADRILVSAPRGDEEPTGNMEATIQHLAGKLDAPLCVVGRRSPLISGIPRSTGRITLILTPGVDHEVPLAFASRFAQERHSRLTLLYVFPGQGSTVHAIDRTPASVALQLSRAILREAEVLCPLEIVVREGDVASQALAYDACLPQDFMFLISPQSLNAREEESSGLRRITTETRCPVLFLREHVLQQEGDSRS